MNNNISLSEIIPLKGATAVRSQNGCKGIILPDNYSVKDWQELGRLLIEFQQSSKWLLGDWLRYAQNRSDKEMESDGELTSDSFTGRCKWVQAELGIEGLNTPAYVCSQIPIDERSDILSFEHHQEVASMDKKERNKFLKMAEFGTAKEPGPWTVARLREEIRKSQQELGKGPKISVGFIPTSWVSEGLRELNRMDVSKWDNTRRNALKNDLRPIVELYNNL